MSDSVMAELRRIKAVASDAVAAAWSERNKPHADRWCVNWGDLDCVDAEYCFSVFGGEVYRVYIEEAAPENEGFRDFVREYMAAHGCPGVEVVTEW